ncbi:MAG TPA: hypothetical protein VMZ28_30085 [Kofleriaceae bacterium]|nr:hypothetical protein [Kofleriaceae bacterium]
MLPNASAGTSLLKQRLIGFFDILGFSNRLATMELDEARNLYARLIDDARLTVFSSTSVIDRAAVRRPNFDRAQFLFDSILVVSHPVDGASAGAQTFNFTAALVDLMEKSFALQLPLRGCIGLGDYLEDSERSIFLSRVFPAIVAAEKSQEWSGCFLLADAAPIVVSALHGESTENLPPERERLLLEYPVPIKSGAPEVQWCLNWVHLIADEDRDAGLAFLCDPKRTHTANFVEHVLRLPSDNASLPTGFLPATQLRKQVAQWGFRLKYCDDSGRGVDPPQGAVLQLRFERRNPPTPE